MLSPLVLATAASSACLINSSQLPSRLYGRSLAFKDSSCLSIRLSPLYLHISHRLPPSIRRKVYQVLSPIPSLIPLAITKSTFAWHSHLSPLPSASCGGVLRCCNVRFTLRPPDVAQLLCRPGPPQLFRKAQRAFYFRACLGLVTSS